MERKVLTTALLLALELARGQNLVPNGSFEEYIDCPTSFGYWDEVVGWISPFTQSADYFNACSENDICGVPFNYFGYQPAADGQAYMGVCTWATLIGGYYREVIATQLIEPLQPGVPVHISFKVSPGGFGASPNNSATWAAKAPSMNFFTQLPMDWNGYLFPNAANVDSPSVLSDTSTWSTINSTFIPDSAYLWIAITNFFDNDHSSLELLDSSAQSDVAYAFIDDVCISYDPSYCDKATNMAGRSESTAIRGCLVEGEIRLWGGSERHGAELMLYDTQARMIWSGYWPSGVESLNMKLPRLTSALYVLSIKTSEGLDGVLRLVNSTDH